jgi:spermidine synthase
MRRREFLALLPTLACACVTTSEATTPALVPPTSKERTVGSSDDEERVLASERSDYNIVIVTQQGSLRRMYFEVADGRWLLQSTYDLERPDSLDHEVFQTMVSGLLVQPEVRRACMLGVGGAQLSNYLFARIPRLEIDVVDICPAVVELARAYFGVPDDPRYRMHVADGRMFVEQSPPSSYELLIHDAYRGHSIPLHLRTQEFFSACAERITSDGVVVANMHRRVPRYPIDRETMASVFRHNYRFYSADDVQTTIVASNAETQLEPEQLLAHAHALQPRFDIDLLGLARRCTTARDWGDAEPLRDDFDRAQLDQAAEQHNRSCAPKCSSDP